VIIATPLEFTSIEIDGEILQKREYRKVYVTYCHGHLNYSYFLQENNSNLHVVLTTEKAKLWNHLGVRYQFEDKSVVIKFFSINPISDEELDRIFIIRYSVKVQYWEDGAYPILKPGIHIPPLILKSNLFYINSFESFISVLEGSVVTAKNIIRILEKTWHKAQCSL